MGLGCGCGCGCGSRGAGAGLGARAHLDLDHDVLAGERGARLRLGLGLVGEDVGLLGGRGGGGGGGLGARDRAGAQREAWVLQAVRLEDLVCGVLGVGVRL